MKPPLHHHPGIDKLFAAGVEDRDVLEAITSDVRARRLVVQISQRLRRIRVFFRAVAHFRANLNLARARRGEPSKAARQFRAVGHLVGIMAASALHDAGHAGRAAATALGNALVPSGIHGIGGGHTPPRATNSNAPRGSPASPARTPNRTPRHSPAAGHRRLDAAEPDLELLEIDEDEGEEDP